MNRVGNEPWHHGLGQDTQELRILDRWDAGQDMATIARALDLPYRTVSRIIGMYCGNEGHDHAAIRAATRRLGDALANYRGPGVLGPAPHIEPVALVTLLDPLAVTSGGDGPLTRGQHPLAAPASFGHQHTDERAAA